MFGTNRYPQTKIIDVLVTVGYTGPREGIFKIDIDPQGATIHYYSADYTPAQQTVYWPNRMLTRHPSG